ncbi:aminomethyltransferase [Paenibacillus cellulosilyticus]|uniref:Aminomethyltransferase n=1 Tax=Paenibacillus cellulosilyticus TaxID=375489 RepID=A0A2V2YMC9_9BACL|nr:glycine cleavage system aminomethyltransferase GcvT [Paenibacillus cellulosilyticus]PWV94376.1 aminomethyltransferase [Paenibacillus cellulosilyticus]QKS43882.1 glycine cleavage system aminomethyltransferase GcvT [Paenibacillus cellulosilyticus]
MTMRRRTPLYPLYTEQPSVRCIDFAGWELPVQFAGIVKEHEAVRQAAGLFDVSHMGRLIVTGLFAEACLQRLTTNDVSQLKDGRAQYSLLCSPSGGILDDLLVYRLSADQYMLVVNAANTAADLDWLREHLIGDVTLEDRTDTTALIALQGPNAEDILVEAAGTTGTYARAIAALAPFQFRSGVPIADASVLVSRTGYTGEDGFELYTTAEDAAAVWRTLLQVGAKAGLQPAGLGARDTLRLEARLPLHGHELSPSITPLEAGLRSFVKLDKGSFIGRKALLTQLTDGGPFRRLVGIELQERGIPRSGCEVLTNSGVRAGYVTSGTHSPTLKRNIGLALLSAEYAEIGTSLIVNVRGTEHKAVVVPAPFYRRSPFSPRR